MSVIFETGSSMGVMFESSTNEEFKDITFPPSDESGEFVSSVDLSASKEQLTSQQITAQTTIIDSRPFRFSFVHYGGRNNLKPGRPEQQTAPLNRPEGAQVFIALSEINCGFINGNLGRPPFQLRERPLGQLKVTTGISGEDLVCRMLLTDENGDDPCVMDVTVNVLYFR